MLTVPAPPAAGPGPPSNLTATVSGTTVALRWSAPLQGEPPTSYVIEAFSSSGNTVATLNTGGLTTQYTATGVPAGTYIVRVRARTATSISAPTNLVQIVVAPVVTPTGVVFSNLGPGDSLDSGGGAISRNDPLFGTAEYAFGFIARQDVILTTIEVAIGYRSGSNVLEVSLMSDNNGQPGTVLESLRVSGAMLPAFSPNRGLLTFASVLRPRLTAGARYWLIASLPGPVALALWNVSFQGSPPVLGAFRRNGGNWELLGPGRGNAFRISGIPP